MTRIYGSSERPEQPLRITRSVGYLRAAHPEWEWRIPAIPGEEPLLTVHTPAHLERLQHPPDFDADTPYFEGIYDHARRSVGAALAAASPCSTARMPIATRWRALSPNAAYPSSSKGLTCCKPRRVAT